MVKQEIQEIWKDVKGYEGLYKVSNLGRVKSLPRKYNWYGTTRKTTEKILVPHLTCNGYLRVLFADNKKYRVHRLVSESFIPNPLKLPQVNHIDGNKQNNSLDNLEWVTQSGNMKHAYEKKLIKAPKGNDSALYGQKWTSKKVKCITTGLEYSSATDAERKLGINHQGISACCSGKYKSAGKHPVTGEKLKWKYLEDSK